MNDKCLYCRDMEVINNEVFCSIECKEAYQEMSHPYWEGAINYDEPDIYQQIRSLDYED